MSEVSDRIVKYATWTAPWTAPAVLNSLMRANHTLNEAEWRGYPAGTLMIDLSGSSRGESWELLAVFNFQEDGWQVLGRDVFARTRFADIVPESAELLGYVASPRG